MIIIFGLKNCDSCRKALKSLDGANLVDVRSEGVPKETLEAAFLQFGDALVNSRSATWRNLTPQERELPVLELIDAHPTVMKRPLIHRGQEFFLGWNKDTQTALL